MLPSTGYFKTINCPFYENGSCERPYCHFKHARREETANAATLAGVVATQPIQRDQRTGTTSSATPGSTMLQQLVSEAVQKVLAEQEVSDKDAISENIISQVVEGLKPSLSSTPLISTSEASLEKTSVIGKHTTVPPPITKPVLCVYNPTPISELKKRHIPVASYMPTRDSKIAVKRKISPDRISKPWHSLIQESSAQRTEITYKPTAIVNTGLSELDSVKSYIPTVKSDSSSSNSYEDSNSNDYMKKKDIYCPKSKKRREEYIPKKIKGPLKNIHEIEESVLGEFDPEFDIIDDIITSKEAAASPQLSDDTQDFSYDIEPKFSDDDEEPMEVDAQKDEKKNTDEKENKKDEVTRNHGSNKLASEKVTDNDKDKVKERKSLKDKRDSTKEDEKSKSKSNKEEPTHSSDKNKKDHRSKPSSRSHEKDRKHRHEKDSKEKSKHKSSSSERNHTSDDKDKARRKSSKSDRESSHRSKDSSDSRKEKSDNKKSDKRDRHKSSRQDKLKSRSSSSKSSSDKHHAGSSHKSSSSSKKTSKKRGSNSERSESDRERSQSPFEIRQFVEDEILEISDSDHDVEEECLKIFQEYEDSEHSTEVVVKEKPKRETPEYEDTSKKRIAHPSAATSIVKQTAPSQPQKRLPNPQKRMYERWRLMREAAAERSALRNQTSGQQNSGTEKPSESNASQNQSHGEPHVNGYSARPPGSIRIAHVPYAMSLALEKKKVTESIAKVAVESKTVAQTSKSGPRVAHIPQSVPQLVRPEPLQVTNQKFPTNVRQHYVNMMQDVCIQIYTNSEDAAQRALREEHACHERCKALAVYKSSCMLAVHRLRKEVDQGTSTSSTVSSGMMSHEAVLAGKSKGSWSVMKVKRSVVDLKGSALYGMLTKWIMTEQQLRDNGFPRPHPDGSKGRAKVYVINARNQTILSKVPNERYCSRCGQSYMVNKYGLAVKEQNCIYHWGRKFTIRGEGRYSCCQQYGSATGCCDAKSHVWDYVDYESLRGYVKTLPKDGPDDEHGVYALDCEMCYTTQGLELTRITVINEECNVIYETLVKPENPIIDYNTRFSGITEENMKGVTTTILDVQATLLTMFSDKTILVGHSLESDFKALKLLHNTVVDTSIMFPHRNGYPQKRALKNLCSEYLRKIIQNDTGGHDSNEDAVACMELVLWKVKEEAKLQ